MSFTEGLPDNHIKSIIQDQNGFIWFGTQNGLARFDGYNLKVYKNDPADPKSLSNNGIWILHEGKSGYIWIGTQNGSLDQYDPHRNIFEHYNICSSKDEENYISCLYEEADGNIWIGTYNKGLYRFNPADKSIKHWIHDDNDANSLSNDFINAIVSDNAGNLWIGTYSGLNRFNPSKNIGLFEKYFADGSNPNSLTNNLIWNITKSKIKPNLFYIGTYKGLTIFNPDEKTFEKFLPVKNPSSQFSNSIGSVVENINDDVIELWLGGYGGLVKYNLSSKKIIQWHHDQRIPGSLVSEQINDMLKDRSGVIWIATEDGISRLPEKSVKFNNNYLKKFSREDRKILNEQEIQALVQTQKGFIFIGTKQGLKYISNRKDKSELIIIPQFKGINVWSLAKGNSNDLWIGTYGKGLYYLEINSFEIKHIDFQSPTERTTPYNYVKSILADKFGKVWVGFWGGGLAVVDFKTGSQKIFRKDFNNSSSISFNDIWKIFRDRFGRIWIGTNGGGLNLFDRKNGDAFFRIPEKDGKIFLNNVISICEQKDNLSPDSVSVLWIGTTEGLIKLEIKNTKYFNDINDIILNSKRYSTKDGLVNDVISEIVEDNEGNLWLTTNFGVSQFITSREKFINFSSDDGLTENNFGSGALLKTADGLIYAGNNRGLNIFRPEEIKLSHFKPQVMFTDFYIHNIRVKISDSSPLKMDISFTKTIVLNYDQNTFTLYFSSLDFNASRQIEYSYLMDGFDKEWMMPKNLNYAAYTNLNPGKYIFKVKATNGDKIWNDSPAELQIIINPPWWKTAGAYAVYIFIIITGFFAMRKFQINRAELRNELKLREFEAKKMQELENLKSRFFANLSHEFRTPLMLIKGPVEKLINDRSVNSCEGKDREDEQLQMIQRSSRKLQELIDQLLELSQLEAASIPLKAKKQNLVMLLRGIVSSFEFMAKQKNIKLSPDVSEEILNVWIDRDKFEKIMNNIISNAFKFTKEGGNVSVNVRLNKTGNQAEIKISDTGIGISDDKIEKIFDRFYQADDSSLKSYGGSGIGLALVKELVELHKWNISVQSEPDKGSEFTLFIPMDDSYLDEKEKIYEESSETEKIYDYKESSNEEVIEKRKIQSFNSKKAQINSYKKLSILIVDDSTDVRQYLSGLLMFETGISQSMNKPHGSLRIIEAENGEVGLKKAIEDMPDLIISDVMMPYMDGIEFCRRIKTTWETAHIPVILLTAKATDESKIEGLETGADDYLTKPFNSKELFVRVKNLIDQRRQLQEKFSNDLIIYPGVVTTNPVDNEFLKQAIAIAEKNIPNDDFDSEKFAKEMYVSKSQLNRKLQAVTGQASGEFLRLIRLKHAANLLLEKRLTITQIALEVGFSSPSHFTKAFRRQFNCLPSEYPSFCTKTAKN